MKASEAPGVSPGLLDDIVGDGLCNYVGNPAGAEFAMCEHKAFVVKVVDWQVGPPASTRSYGDFG